MKRFLVFLCAMLSFFDFNSVAIADNIALNEGVTIWSSGYYGGNAPELAIDGNFYSAWVVDSWTADTIIYLDAVYDISSVTVIYESSTKLNRTVNDTLYVDEVEVASWDLFGMLQEYIYTANFDAIGSEIHLNSYKTGWVAYREIEIYGTFVEALPAPVPEPATMLLLGSGLVGLAGFKKRSKRS